MDDSGYGMEQRFRELVEIAGDFAWEIDASTRFIFASPRLVFGWPAENLLGKTIAEFLDDPDQAKLFAATEPATADEIRFRAADGGTILLALAARPVFGPGGVWSGARGICRVSGVQDLTQADQHIRDGLAGHVVRAVRDATQPESALTAALTALGLAVGASGGAILRAGSDPPLRTSITWGAKPPPAGLMMVRNAIQDKEAASVSAPACQLMVHAVHYRHELKGVVLLWRRAEEQPFGGLDRTLLGDVADHLGIVIAQIEARERITTLSRTDPLTTLTNRNAFFDEFARRLLRLD
ncbi:MAG TPA: PAS domain-containing protein, partial [Stellaceae bacterium]|nr:PAS domain-containing protein [Stellaceae bacterium]